MDFIRKQNEIHETQKIEETLDRNKFIIRKKNEALEGIKDMTDFGFEWIKETIQSKTLTTFASPKASPN